MISINRIYTHTRLFAIALMILFIIDINQALTIQSLHTAVADRDFALDITADVVNTQQGWLYNHSRHIEQLNQALTECMHKPILKK